jgi:lipid A disaccharide synthetase
VNVLAGHKIVLELLQKQLTASRLLTVVNGFLNNRDQLAKNQKKIFKIIQPLALKDVYKNTGSYIIKY